MKTQNYLLSSKILFTVVAIYFCSMQICMAQYQPFPSKGSMWIVNDNAFPYCKNIDYFSHNDTLINGKAYTQVLASIENYYCTGPPIDTLFVYAGCYRNDTVAKKVYWFSKDSLAEYLLYTFGVKVGDTLQSEIYNMIGNTQPIDVKLKDSVLLNDGTYRNSYWIGFASQSNPTQRIIEGIGSDGGLIEPLWHGISNSYTLIFFTMDSTSLYPAWGGNCSPNVPIGASSGRTKRNGGPHQSRMKDADAKVTEVVDAFRQRGFEFIGRADDGWLKLRGLLRASARSHACEIQLDPKFFELPRVRLLELPASLQRVTPHLGSGGHLCYIAKGTVVLDIFDPVGQALACLQRAEEVLDKVLKGEFVEDLEEEFYFYWNGPLCLVDMQDQRLGRQEALVINPGGNFTAVVTDDEAQTTRKLKSLGWEATDYTMLTYRVRTSAKPRPPTTVWPPTTVKDILAWQGLLDPRCRKKIETRIEEALATTTKGALVLVESPLMTYGFVVFFGRKP